MKWVLQHETPANVLQNGRYLVQVIRFDSPLVQVGSQWAFGSFHTVQVEKDGVFRVGRPEAILSFIL